MNSNCEISRGQVVIPKAGRDKNRLMVVVDIVDEYVILADGAHRLVEKPKKKKIKHVFPTRYIIDGIAACDTNMISIENHELREYLKKHDEFSKQK